MLHRMNHAFKPIVISVGNAVATNHLSASLSLSDAQAGPFPWAFLSTHTIMPIASRYFFKTAGTHRNAATAVARST